MITPSDLLRLPYTPDLTESGIAFACRSLASSSGHLGASPADRLKRIVGGMAAELAFRRSLSEWSIPYKVLGAAPFTHPDWCDVSLGGHRCELKSYLITRRQQIALIRKDPAILLQAPALVPVDKFAAEGHRPDDLYIFLFLLAEVAAAREDVETAAAAGQPSYLIHPLPDEWAHPVDWVPLDKLVLKSECENAITMEIGGQNAGREFVSATLELPSKKRVPVEQNFHTVAYLHTARLPEARIGLHSPSRGNALIIPSHAWRNIWMDGMDVFLIGWLSHEEYRRKSKVLNAGMHTFQYDRTRMKNLLVPLAELNPLRPLFERVKAWSANQKTANGM